MMGEPRFDIPLPETIPETEANRQIEHHINVSASLTARQNDCGPKLDVLASTLIEGEADAQPFSLPPAGNRQYDVGVSGGWCQIEVGLNVKFQAAQRLCAPLSISVR
jgi:hypothetical protein